MEVMENAIKVVVFGLIGILCGLIVGEALTTTDIVVDNYPVDGF